MAVVDIHRATSEEEREFYALCVAQDRWIEEWVEGSMVFVAVRGGELIAGLREWITSDGRSTLVDLWVREDARGARLGHALIARMTAAISASEIYLDCVRSLGPYYAEIGFHEIDRSLAPDILDPDELPGSIVMVLKKPQPASASAL